MQPGNTSTPPGDNDNYPRRPPPSMYGGNFLLAPTLQDYLAPDLILPGQYFGQQQLDNGLRAERALMYAVLKDGIRHYCRHIGAVQRKYNRAWAEAERWLLDDCCDYPFSFRVICETLGIGADCLRERLVEWKEAEIQRRKLTGDTSSVRVGRSPFPVPIDLDAIEAATGDGGDARSDDAYADDDPDDERPGDSTDRAYADWLWRAA